MLLRSIVPRVYFRNPSVSITPGKPGLLNAIFAQIQERVDNKLLVQMKMKKWMKRAIQDAFLKGTGGIKIGYGAQYTPSPSEGGVEAPLFRGGRVEYRASVYPNMPWCGRVETGRLIVPDMCGDIDEAEWIVHEVERPFDDVKDDKRFKTTDLTPTRTARVQVGGSGVDKYEIIPMIKLWEIRDRKWGRYIVLSSDHNNTLADGVDDLSTLESFNTIPIIFNTDDEVFWGLPDSAVIEPQQREMNEIRTQMMKHRRLTLVKILYEMNSIDEGELVKMLDEKVGAGVKVKDINKVKPIQVGDIPGALGEMGELVLGDLRQSVGFSRNQGGEFQGGERVTATEVSVVQMASELRVDERRDIVADVLGDAVNVMHQVEYKNWGQEQIIDLVGPGGVQVWVAFAPEMLKGGAFEIHVDADSGEQLSRSQRENKAAKVYEILKTNPLIDPVKLTKHLLRELHGVQYDDLMQNLPQGAGLTSPMNVGQYAQMMNNGQRMGLPPPKQLQQGGQSGAK